jgi:hypothetical protein
MLLLCAVCCVLMLPSCECSQVEYVYHSPGVLFLLNVGWERLYWVRPRCTQQQHVLLLLGVLDCQLCSALPPH